MYRYLFGNSNFLPVYDLIGILGYFIIIGFTLAKSNLSRKNASLGTLSLYLRKQKLLSANNTRTQEKCQNSFFWAKIEIAAILVAHLATFTFGGKILGPLLGRRTDYYGYVAFTNIVFCIVCYFFGLNILEELDNLVPIYLSLASLLKIGCLCAGCCYGHEWEHGLFNSYTQRHEFPIQLVECAFYLILLFFFTKNKAKFTIGTISPLFLTSYALLRFFIQFFRDDFPPFSLFHLISLIAVLVGIIHFLIVKKYGIKIAKNFKLINVKYAVE